MKKVITVAFVLLLGVSVFAQENEKSFLSKKNEVKVNLPLAIFASFPEVSYERVLQEDFSVGFSVGALLSGAEKEDVTSQFTPYLRWFFGGNRESARKYAAGFFIEANAAVLTKKQVIFESYDRLQEGGVSYPYERYKNQTKVGAGLGLGLGWKYVSKNNWCGEILLGVGKDFKQDGGYPRIGVSIGKRF